MKMIIRCLMICLIIVCLIFRGFLGVQLSAQDERGLIIGGAQKITDKQGKEVLLYQESHALVIGISNYTDWPKLPGVKKDVQEVKAALETHGFHVVVKMDLDKNTFIQTFDEFINQYGHQPDSRLLIYFAGHGETLQLAYGGEMGYIVPADAPLPDEDTQGFLAKAMDMQMIEVYAKRIQAKHALFVFDSCFSGSIFALSRAAPKSITYKTANPIRQFITSGSANETVPDESIFCQQFIMALEGEGDKNGDGYVTGAELGIYLEDTVINYSKGTQHPQYGKIRDPNLDKGDFVFTLPEQQEPELPVIVEKPPERPFSLGDLEKAAKIEEDIKVAWQANLSKMEGAFSEVNAYEQRDVSAELKIKAWERFTQSFSTDNPYSTRDEELLSKAHTRIRYWRERVRPVPTPTPTATPRPLTPSRTPTPRPEYKSSAKRGMGTGTKVALGAGAVAALGGGIALAVGGSGDDEACAGTVVGGYCWYLGDWGESCTQVCAPHGGYHDATRTYAGSEGTNEQCWAVLSALDAPPDYDGVLHHIGEYKGIGCVCHRNSLAEDAITHWYRGMYPTSADAYSPTRHDARACACNG